MDSVEAWLVVDRRVIPATHNLEQHVWSGPLMSRHSWLSQEDKTKTSRRPTQSAVRLSQMTDRLNIAHSATTCTDTCPSRRHSTLNISVNFTVIGDRILSSRVQKTTLDLRLNIIYSTNFTLSQLQDDSVDSSDVKDRFLSLAVKRKRLWRMQFPTFLVKTLNVIKSRPLLHYSQRFAVKTTCRYTCTYRC